MPYFEVKSTFKEKENLGKGCSPKDEFDNEDLQLDDNSYQNPTCLKGFFCKDGDVLLHVMKKIILEMKNP